MAERSLTAWFKLAKHATWANFGALKQTFPSADQVGNCVVFDVANNMFRLVGRVIYDKGRVYTLKVMDHQEYDNNQWIDDCGCQTPPTASTKRPPVKKPPEHRKPKRRR